MQLFDTLRGTSATLESQDRPLTLYVCGVTPYDTTHIGHARTFLIFDVLQRYLRAQGAEVRYCQNVTDVDDPLFERAQRDGIDWAELARREIAQFRADCAAMNMLVPTYTPLASQEIPGMLAIIERLIELGYGYVRGGGVYYRARMAADYGAMPKLDYAGLLATANQRGNNPDDAHKEDPLDFVLWQPSRAGEPAWPSPWGPGRPGWHIECTAMATRYLGEQIDIHGGGSDLIFPHHPSEIAQTEPVTGVRPFVRFWVHGGMARLGGEKMSKSLGNIVFVRDALQEHSADALRWYLMSFPYRDDFDYVTADVVATEAKIAQLAAALRAVGGAGSELDATPARAAFLAAMDDNLNTPLALTVLDDLASAVVRGAAAGQDVGAAQAVLGDLAGTFGFLAAHML
ncbi:MAG: cysteine--tRNA ligase [Roseiflexaceae bacterium]|nr:cysteine--tRNA ligase [Roseiflexaceae bacterium]